MEHSYITLDAEYDWGERFSERNIHKGKTQSWLIFVKAVKKTFVQRTPGVDFRASKGYV